MSEEINRRIARMCDTVSYQRILIESVSEQPLVGNINNEINQGGAFQPVPYLLF